MKIYSYTITDLDLIGDLNRRELMETVSEGAVPARWYSTREAAKAAALKEWGEMWDSHIKDEESVYTFGGGWAPKDPKDIDQEEVARCVALKALIHDQKRWDPGHDVFTSDDEGWLGYVVVVISAELD